MADKTLHHDESPEPGGSRPPTAARPPTTAPLRVFKPRQGTHVRWATAVGAGVIAVAGARFVHEWMRVPFPDNLVLRTLIPVVLLVAVGCLIFIVVGRKRGTVDFMIATEGEMKKVNWSTRKEVLGATRVVIFTVLALGTLLFVVDLFFMMAFSLIGVLKIPVWERLFGSST